jgi:Pectate lyase superfamily protein
MTKTLTFLGFFALVSASSTGCGPTPPDPPNGTGGAGGSGGSAATGPWRSSLYPADWKPGFSDETGRSLQDFSYAGFRYGETPDPGALTTIEVAGADPTGMVDATQILQSALDAAAAKGGAIVHVPAGLYRVDGLLQVSNSNLVLRGDGPTKTRLYFSKTADMSYKAHLSFSAPLTVDLETPLVTDGVVGSTLVPVTDVMGFAPGDDIAIGFTITPEFINEHNMTGTWIAFNDTWQTVFRRTVKAVNGSSSPPTLEIDVPLRYPVKVRDGASVRREKGYLTNVGVESLGLANAASWDEAWSVNQTHVLEFLHTSDGYVRDVVSFPSPLAPAMGDGSGGHLLSGGVLISESKRVTVERVEMSAAQNRGGGGNGYLFEIQRSNEVLIRDSKGTAGRHNFIQNWGFGTTGCVWLRCESREGRAYTDKDSNLGVTGYSEYHHSLATANLVDASLFDDGFSTINRQGESTGAGITGTMNVVWNVRGTGTVRSMQYGWGYVIGTSGPFLVTESPLPLGQGTEPIDYIEGQELGSTLEPQSLYDDQRQKRLMMSK